MTTRNGYNFNPVVAVVVYIAPIRCSRVESCVTMPIMLLDGWFYFRIIHRPVLSEPSLAMYPSFLRSLVARLAVDSEI